MSFGGFPVSDLTLLAYTISYSLIILFDVWSATIQIFNSPDLERPWIVLTALLAIHSCVFSAV